FRTELTAPTPLAEWSYERMWRTLVAFASRVDLEILESACNRARRRVLPQRWDALTDAERRSMRRNLAVPAVRFNALGQFDPTNIDDVELIAHGLEDARKWAAWLQWDGINDYCTPASL